MITAIISRQNTVVLSDNAVADSVKYLALKLQFSKDWDGYAKTVVFRHPLQDTPLSVVLDPGNGLCPDENTCLVPHEVIKNPGFTFSVFGTKTDSRITTAETEVSVALSGYGSGAVPSEPTPTQYEQLTGVLQQTQQIAQSVRDDADNGVFKGEKGDQGLQGVQGPKGDTGATGQQGQNGSDGYTPVKGTDYFTPDDIAGLNIPAVDQTYSATSTDAQSGTAVAAAITAAIGDVNSILASLVTGNNT